MYIFKCLFLLLITKEHLQNKKGGNHKCIAWDLTNFRMYGHDSEILNLNDSESNFMGTGAFLSLENIKPFWSRE